MYEQVSSSVTTGDRISALPDEVICSCILSKLSVEESARTSILSKRWCKLWLLSPINISDESIINQSRIYFNQQSFNYSFWIINTLSHIISTHPGPIHTCRFILPIWDEHQEALLKLLRTLTQKGIRNLQIDDECDLSVLPCFVLECKSLIDVELCGLSTPDQFQVGRQIFSNLRKLTMVLSYVTHEFLVNLLSSKSLIELKLSRCFGPYCHEDVVIESDSLQKISIGNYCSSNDLIIKNVPNLESFNYYDLPSNARVVILHAPKLKFLSCINMKTLMLQLGNYRFRFHKKYMEISGEITYLPSLRSLKIIVDINHGYEAKSIPYFLKCFPCLEILEVKIFDYRGIYFSSQSSNDDDYVVVHNNANDDYDNFVHRTSNINCLNHHLTNLRVENYSGRQAHLDFANLIIGNARVLETVTLVYGNNFEEKWIKAQRQFLMQNRASKMLRVEFLKRVGFAWF